MTGKSKALVGILGAVAAGVVIALLIAPEKGKDVRKKLRKAAGEWADSLAKLLAETREAVGDLKEDAMEAKTSAEHITGKIKQSMG